jgi:hypothetical protein
VRLKNVGIFVNIILKHNNIYFYNCKIIFHVIQYIQTLFCEEDNVKFDQQSLILSYNKGKEKGILLGNMLIFVAKWKIWKQRNKIKYQNILCKTATLIKIFKAELKENLIPRQKYYQNTSPNIDKEINYIIIKLN